MIRVGMAGGAPCITEASTFCRSAMTAASSLSWLSMFAPYLDMRLVVRLVARASAAARSDASLSALTLLRISLSMDWSTPS